MLLAAGFAAAIAVAPSPAWSQAAPAASDPPPPLSVSPNASTPASVSPNQAPIRSAAPNQEPVRAASPNTAPVRSTAPNTSVPATTAPGGTATSGGATTVPATSPGTAECMRLRQQFRDSQACFAPYRLAGGGIRPDAYRVCREVADPAPRCGPEVRP